ncbi:AraC family transcriptional regulator [Eubacterium sp.]|uniref:AraC family transcriptional regulator n=1 Tax=Eubacterium sp. TaxID=142586 RepID=UPI003F030880
MKSNEAGVLKKSEVYFSSPSQTAKKIYFYPISAGHFFCVKGYHLVRKNYSSLLITHILDGTFTYIKDGKHTTAHKGDTVILDCYKPHEYYTNDSFESIWVHIAGANSVELFEEIENTVGNLVKCKDIQHVEKLLFRIFDGIKSDNPPSELSLSLDIYKLLAELLNPQSAKSKGENSYEDCVQIIKEFIAENLNEGLTVSRLADIVNMSSSHFSRIFKRQTGFSPYDYILISRLNRAKYLLQVTDMTVASIAYETGFNSESNFIYFFTENEGISPGKFRKLTF